MKAPDLWIFLPAALLTLLGLLISSTVSPAEFDFQWKVAIISIFLSFVVSRIDSEILYLLGKPLYISSILMLILVLLFTDPIRGSRRWLAFGPLVLQVSEFSKLSLILLFASLASNFKLINIVKYLTAVVLILIPAALIFAQPDLGSTLILLAIGSMLLISLKPKKRYVFISLFLILIMIPIGYTLLAPYQKARINHFINPTDDPLGASYNQIQAVIAVGSGQLIGLGLGKGSQSRLHFLPEKQTDFIFATASEQLGFISSSLIVLLFAGIGLRALHLMDRIDDKKAKVVFLGCMGLIFVQAIIHIGINIGILPVTGIPLPFISVGGSSMLISWLSVGIMLSVEKDHREVNAFQII